MKLHAPVICVLMIVGGFYLATMRQGHSWGDDFSMYIHHAKNIVEGVDYQATGYIYNPSRPIAPKTYPPILPLLLSPIYKWYGLNLELMKIEVTLFFLASLYMLFLIFKNELPYHYILAILVLIGFNPFFWDYKDNISVDLPFIFFTYLSIYLIQRQYEVHLSDANRSISSILIGLSIYLSYGTRSVGILLIPCLITYDLIKNHRITALSIYPIAVFSIFFFIQNSFLHSEVLYINQFNAKSSVKIVEKNFAKYVMSFYFLIFGNVKSIILYFLFLFTSTLSVIGYFYRIKKHLTPIEIFSIVYICIIVLWPYWEGVRFLLVVTPFYFLYAFIGLNTIGSLSGKLIQHYLLIGLVLIIYSLYILQYSKMDFGQLHEGILKKESVELFEYIKRETHEQDVFIFSKPRTLALFSGRKASTFHRTHDDQALWEYFRAINATYLVIGPPRPLVGYSFTRDIAASLFPSVSVFYVGDLQFLRQFVLKYQSNFQEVYTNADFQVYKIRYRHDD